MNIFVVHRNPVISAQSLADTHVVKMILETAQMLSTVLQAYGVPTTYKATHAHHPCTVWASKSAQNYAWLLKHGLALCDEYTHRYKRTHKTEALLRGELHALPPGIPVIGQTEFAQAMPDEYRNEDVVIAYRTYYINAKASIAKWTNRDAPAWFEYKLPELNT